MSKNSENYFSSKTKRRIFLHFDFVEKVLLIKFVNFVNLRIGMAYAYTYLQTIILILYRLLKQKMIFEISEKNENCPIMYVCVHCV